MPQFHKSKRRLYSYCESLHPLTKSKIGMPMYLTKLMLKGIILRAKLLLKTAIMFYTPMQLLGQICWWSGAIRTLTWVPSICQISSNFDRILLRNIYWSHQSKQHSQVFFTKSNEWFQFFSLPIQWIIIHEILLYSWIVFIFSSERNEMCSLKLYISVSDIFTGSSTSKFGYLK